MRALTRVFGPEPLAQLVRTHAVSTAADACITVSLAGSLFFSHVNDAGFWLVKEYFGLNVGQTIKTWSVMETIISVVAGGTVLLLSLIL